MKKLVLAFATIIACVSAANAQTQQQSGVLSGQRPVLQDNSRSLDNATRTPTTPQSVTPNSTTPGTINTNPTQRQPSTTPIGSPTQPGNPSMPATTTPGMPPNPSDRNIR